MTSALVQHVLQTLNCMSVHECIWIPLYIKYFDISINPFLLKIKCFVGTRMNISCLSLHVNGLINKKQADTLKSYKRLSFMFLYE